MNKSEIRELNKAQQYMGIFESTHDANVLAMVARMMASLIRASRTNKSRNELMKAANDLGVSGHSEFIVTYWG